MSSKNSILENVKRHISTQYDMPDLAIDGIQYSDKIAQFIDISKTVGGYAVLVNEGEDINAIISGLYPDAKVIASNLSEISIATVNLDNTADPHDLNGTDLSIIRGEGGVAENGCIWIPQNVKEKKN